MMSDTVVIGTRGSKLALIQVDWVVNRIREHSPGTDIRIEIIKTTGDKNKNAAFINIGAMGIFVREIEHALLDNKIDIAVHSLKDLQTDIDPALEISAIGDRVGARDVLLSREGHTFAKLPNAAIIGTSSARRRGLILTRRKDFQLRECRGNLETRIRKLQEGQFDAIVMAEAGLQRLGMTDVITEYLEPKWFVPAVGQGALGIEVRTDDRKTKNLVKHLNHLPSFLACTEERDFLSRVGGGCHAPVGAYVRFEGEAALMDVFVGTIDGSWHIHCEASVPSSDLVGLGRKLAEEVKNTEGSSAFFEELNHN